MTKLLEKQTLPTETAEEQFNMKEYADALSDERVQQAANFIDNAEASWLMTYSIFAKTLTTVEAERDNAVQERMKENRVNVEGKEVQTTLPHFIEEVTAFAQAVPFFRSLVEKGFASPAQFEEAINKGWEKVMSAVGLWDPPSTPILETLSWLKAKILRDEVIILATALGKNDQQRKEIAEFEKSVATPFALGSASKIDKTQPDILILAADLVNKDASSIEILISLAHERGHEILNESDDQLDMSADTQIVFQEFFPMLEAERAYMSLTPEEKAQMSDSSKGFYELPPEFQKGPYEGQIPGLKDKVLSRPSLNSWILLLAYRHSLENHQRKEKYSVFQKMRAQGESDESIQAKLQEIKLVTTPVVDIYWQEKAKKLLE